MGKVSIIIPNFNHAAYLPDCLDSCILQGKEFVKEIIVVDDHSTDDSWEVIKRYENKYPDLVKGFRNPRKGACAARNFGFEQSSGEYIQWLDADDLLGEKKIVRQLEKLKDNKDAIIACKWYRFYESLDNISHAPGPYERHRKSNSSLEWLIQLPMICSHAWLTPTVIAQKTRGWNEALEINQDGEYFIRVISQAKKVLFCNEAKVFYRSGLPDSTSVIKPEKLESLFCSVGSYEKVLLELESSGRSRLAIANYYQKFIFAAYPFRRDLVSKAEKRIQALNVQPTEKYDVRSQKGKFFIFFLGWKNFKKVQQFRQKLKKSFF
jgi:glycosyltransferase involved in cell wall biosynthesis